MNRILKEIFESNQVVDENGKVHLLHSHTSKEQCEFLQDLIREIAPSSCIEIGLAYGISTLAMLERLAENGKPFTYTVIDPFQKEHWNNIGLTNIAKMGFLDRVRFFHKFSDQVLPELYNGNNKIQFAYIDSTKVFDILMVDLYYLTKMLNKGGLIVFDDCGFPGIKLLIRFLTKHPSFKVYKGFCPDIESYKMRILRRLINRLVRMIPFRKRVLGSYNFESDKMLGVNFHCIAFKKIQDDERGWNWFVPF
jgi:predicted O-methyltransferase YrrM